MGKLHLQFFILICVMRELRFKSRRIDLRNESREQSRSKRNPVYEKKTTTHTMHLDVRLGRHAIVMHLVSKDGSVINRSAVFMERHLIDRAVDH